MDTPSQRAAPSCLPQELGSRKAVGSRFPGPYPQNHCPLFGQQCEQPGFRSQPHMRKGPPVPDLPQPIAPPGPGPCMWQPDGRATPGGQSAPFPLPFFLPITYFSLAGSRWGATAPLPPHLRSAALCDWVTSGSTRAYLQQKGPSRDPISTSANELRLIAPTPAPSRGSHRAGTPALTLAPAAADLAEQGALAEAQQALLADQLQELRLQPLTQLPGMPARE